MPQVTDNGKTYTIKLRKGIYFTPDPAFKGKKRELIADDYVYSLKRLIDPKIRSPWALLVEGKIVGLDEVADAAKKTGKFDYDTKIAGPRGGRPLHAAHPAEGHRLQPAVRARARADVRRRARGDRDVRATRAAARWRIRSAPARTGSRNGCAARRSSSRPIRTTAASSGTSRRAIRPTDKLIARDEGQEDAAGRPHRDQHHGGGPGAAARVPERRARPHEHGGAARAQRARRRQAEARVRGQGHEAVALRRPRDHATLLEHAGSGRRRPHARRRSRCAARWRWRTTSTRRSRSCATARRSRRSIPIPPGVVGHDPNYGRASSTTRPAPTRCSTSSATRRAPTAGARCPTASRSSSATLAPGLARPPAGRAVEEGVRRDRHPHGGAEGQVPRAPEAREAVQAHDAHRVVDRRLSGRRQLHAAPLRHEHLPEQQRLRDDSRVRQALRAVDRGCRLGPSATSSTTRWRRSSRPTRRGGSTSAATATSWCSRGCMGYKKHPILHSEWQYIDVAPVGTRPIPGPGGSKEEQ